MWEVWRCPRCKNYYEEIAINEHKEECHGRTTKPKELQQDRLQERTRGESSVERTEGNRGKTVL